jgi:hypothetical protein
MNRTRPHPGVNIDHGRQSGTPAAAAPDPARAAPNRRGTP